jgi:hypothetical protein
MQPIPCNHCGFNFMRQTTDPEAPKLCNSCALREEKRSPTKKDNMEKVITIQIQFPIKIHNEIEEYCINQGISLSQYFIDMHARETIFYKEKLRLAEEEKNNSRAIINHNGSEKIEANPVHSKGKKK